MINAPQSWLTPEFSWMAARRDAWMPLEDAGPPCQLQRFVRRRLAYEAEGASVHRLADSRRVPDRHLARDNRLAGPLHHERRDGRAAGEQELERPGVIHYHDEPARPRLDTHTLL